MRNKWDEGYITLAFCLKTFYFLVLIGGPQAKHSDLTELRKLSQPDKGHPWRFITFSWRSRTWQERPCFLYSFSIFTGDASQSTKQEKKEKPQRLQREKFASKLIIYIQNLKEPKKNYLLMSDFSKVPKSELTCKNQLHFYILTTNSWKIYYKTFLLQ